MLRANRSSPPASDTDDSSDDELLFLADARQLELRIAIRERDLFKQKLVDATATLFSTQVSNGHSVFLSHFPCEERSFAEARLGTNLTKTPKQRPVFARRTAI
eukprot:COSAG06_NODE_9395_length_1912_cov_1.337010_1_plen_102_part_10